MRRLLVLLFPMEYNEDGILLLILFFFPIYIDNLSLILSESRLGYYIDDFCMCKFSLCYKYNVEIDFNFNRTKSYYATFTL